jgi:hypothetical protein
MKQLIFFIFTLALTACGGGGSNSGGGGGTPASFAGTYNGFATVTLSAPGLSPNTATGTIQIVIDAQGNVTSDPSTDFSGTGTLSGNTFTVAVPAAAFNQAGVRCTGAVMITGTVSGETITGAFSANGFTCNGISFQVNGTYEAARVPAAAKAAQPTGVSAMESLRGAIN